MFRNSSGAELNITYAFNQSWMDNVFYYWDLNGCPEPKSNCWKFLSSTGDKSNLSAWEGYFIRTLKDNITMLRQN